MTQTRRIVFNVLATYGRSLLAMLCGLFTSRWVLQALGTEAYGVFGVVGAIIGMVTIVNGMLSVSVSRYYAFVFGRAKTATDAEQARDDCCRWFNVALFVHAVLPTSFCIIGLFAGEWAIDNYFSIPQAYLATSHWVFRFAIVTVMVSVLSVPFRGLFVAQQLIAELTMFEVAVPIVNICCAWWLLSYKGDKLFANALYMMLLGTVPNFLIAARAMKVFPECHIDFGKMCDVVRIKKLMAFAGWQLLGWSAYTLRTQFVSVIVNKMLGLRFNATIGIASTVADKASTLSNSLRGAFVPAITNAAGADDAKKMYSLSLRACKFGTLLCALFAFPLMSEMPYVIKIWLTTFPPQLEMMSCIMLMTLVIERMSGGAFPAIVAMGNVKVHEIWNALCFLAGLLGAYILVRFTSLGIIGIGLAILANSFAIMLVQMILWRRQLNFPIMPWISFSIRFSLVSILVLGIGAGMKSCMEEGFIRLLSISTIMSLIFISACHLFVLDINERNVIQAQFMRHIRRFYVK